MPCSSISPSALSRQQDSDGNCSVPVVSQVVEQIELCRCAVPNVALQEAILERRNLWKNFSVAYQQWHSEINVDALHVAITVLQALHPILRTTYYKMHQLWGQEVQKHPFSFEEIATFSSATSKQDAEKQAKQFVDQQSWNLLGHPPWRILVITGNLQTLLVVHVHHVAVDGISIARLDQDLRQDTKSQSCAGHASVPSACQKSNPTPFWKLICSDMFLSFYHFLQLWISFST